MSFIKELIEFIVSRRNYWMIPIIIVMSTLGALLVFSQGSTVAPFIYTLF